MENFLRSIKTLKFKVFLKDVKSPNSLDTIEKQWNGLAVTKILNPFVYFEVSNSDLRPTIEMMKVCYTVGTGP